MEDLPSEGLQPLSCVCAGSSVFGRTATLVPDFAVEYQVSEGLQP